jgi:hypothetical protein
MDKERLYLDFKLFCKMKAATKYKVGMLTHLFAEDVNRWRVVGITKDALKLLEDNNFDKKGLKIHRAHKKDRYSVYDRMMKREFEGADDWWKYYYVRDKTILATSSENSMNKFSDVIRVDPRKGYFKSSGYSWTHNKKERQFLNSLMRK